jgi:CheY-like chemotaxis protein
MTEVRSSGLTSSRALIVEDDRVTRTLLMTLLRAQGCQVDAAEDGESALALIAQNDYGVIVLDIVLPKMSGTEVMDVLRADTPDLLRRIIVVTGLNVAEIRALFPAVCDTLSKPVMPSRLLQAVDVCLNGAHGQITAV